MSDENIEAQIIDNTTPISNPIRNRLTLWRIYLIFSILVTLFVPFLFLHAGLDDSVHMNPNSLAMIILFIFFSAGVFLFFDAMQIRKTWKKSQS